MNYDLYARGGKPRVREEPFLRRGWFVLGLLPGLALGGLARFANENYEALKADAPDVILLTMALMAFVVISLALGLVLWMFGRRGMISLFLGELAGVAIASVALQLVS